MSDTREERIAVIKTGSDEAMNKNRGGLGGEGGSEAIDVA